MPEIFRKKLTAADIKAKARELGADLVGIADGAELNAHPPDPVNPKRPSDITDLDSDRVIVLISSRSPSAMKLLRKTARLADRLRAPWFAVYVQTPSERTERIDAETQRRISETLLLARQLGGVPVELKAEDFATAVADYVRRHAITQVVVGRSRRPWYSRWLRRSPIERMIDQLPGVDITVCGKDG